MESKEVLSYQDRAPRPASEYSELVGRIHGELDPGHPLNAIITDLELAPRNLRGTVENSAKFTLLMPSDAVKLGCVLMYEVPNRGNSPQNAGAFPNDLAAGHVLLSSGWQGDPVGSIQMVMGPVD